MLLFAGKKKGKTDGSMTLVSFSAPKPKTVPPGLGFTQPPRPVQPVIQPTRVKREQAVDYPQFVVAFGFEAENVDELDAEIGKLVIGLSQVDENWWMCQDMRGRQGMIPADFLREPEDEERVPQARFNDSLGKQTSRAFFRFSAKCIRRRGADRHFRFSNRRTVAAKGEGRSDRGSSREQG